MDDTKPLPGYQQQEELDWTFPYKCVNCPAKFQLMQEAESHFVKHHPKFSQNNQEQKSPEKIKKTSDQTSSTELKVDILSSKTEMPQKTGMCFKFSKIFRYNFKFFGILFIPKV